jgi:hypothetical protein
MAEPEFTLPPIPLGQALAAMPLESPERSAWPLLATRLRPRKRFPRWTAAIAAGLLALALLPSGWLADPGHAPATIDSSTPATNASAQRLELAALMSESARLERLVATASDEGASSGTAVAMSLELEDELRAIDADLEANRDPARQLSLWQQRVRLMRDVAAVETSRHYLAAQGRNFDVALVSAY